MKFQTSNYGFKRRNMRYQKQIWVSILFDTLFRYLFQVPILFDTLFVSQVRESILFDTSLRYQFQVSIPLSIPKYRYRYRYQVSIPAIPDITSSSEVQLASTRVCQILLSTSALFTSFNNINECTPGCSRDKLSLCIIYI